MLQVIQVDNGSEFTSRVIDEWAYRNKVKLHFIEPGKHPPRGHPQNGHIESFNGKLRDECLDMAWFTSLQEAKNVIEARSEDLNSVGLRSALAIAARGLGANRKAKTTGNTPLPTDITWGTRSVARYAKIAIPHSWSVKQLSGKNKALHNKC